MGNHEWLSEFYRTLFLRMCVPAESYLDWKRRAEMAEANLRATTFHAQGQAQGEAE